MDYYGLYPKFKVNRPLNEKEKSYQLHQKKCVKLTDEKTIISDVSVIKVNSTYLEVVDKYYEQKGIVGSVTVFGLFILLGMLSAMIFTSM